MANSVSTAIWSNLYYLYMAIAVIIGGLVVGWLLYSLVKFRARPGMPRPRDAPRAGVLPAERGHPIFSYIMAIVIAAIMFGLAFGTIGAIHAMETPPPDEEQLPMDVTGFQFGWRVNYTGVGGIPVSRVNEWTVPVDTPVVMNVTSQDVWHNFALPDYRIRIDSIPGETTHIWFQATEIATVQPVCVQICGVGHALMKSTMHVVSKEDFATYLKTESDKEYARHERQGGAVLNASWSGSVLQVEDKSIPANKPFVVNLTNDAAFDQRFTLGTPGNPGVSLLVKSGEVARLYARASPEGAYVLDAPGTGQSASLRSVS